jgi:hypothetical protein
LRWVVLGVGRDPPAAVLRGPLVLPADPLPALRAEEDGAEEGIGLSHQAAQLAMQMLQLLCGRFENRRFHAVGDSAYGGKSVLLHLPANCDLTSRLTLDARLYDAPLAVRNRKCGRPRKRGERLPTPERMLSGRCRRLTLDIYGRKDKSRVAEATARCHAAPGVER